MERDRREVRSQPNFYDQLKNAVEKPKRKGETLDILRAFSRRVLGAILTNRAEQIYPVENVAFYLWRTLNAKEQIEKISSDPFIKGYLNAFCDIIAAAQDVALSEEIIEKVSKNHAALRIIEELAKREDAHEPPEGRFATVGELSKKLNLKRDELAKVLKFTEEVDLTRRSILGKNRDNQWIVLSPQGLSYYNALVEKGSIKKP